MYGSPSAEEEKYNYQQAKRIGKELATKHIKRLISADDIQENSPEWLLLMQLKTMIDEDRA